MQSIKTINSRTKDLQRVASMERILAINASVEAARAGQAGVGFAVVANEIGELSSNATSVYTEIQEIAASMGKSMHQMSSIELD
ncbi:methyl-accepting chemotaxis protein [Aminipila sp.]|uniref:methyl-accepting chemotaxis protein n=1 Tax=Aminipila sp. TaxID=2060095 RepID=UPI0028A2A1DD|nr:methyl-accepting chemotaxis protein [Aminipila sp.]